MPLRILVSHFIHASADFGSLSNKYAYNPGLDVSRILFLITSNNKVVAVDLDSWNVTRSSGCSFLVDEWTGEALKVVSPACCLIRNEPTDIIEKFVQWLAFRLGIPKHSII